MMTNFEEHSGFILNIYFDKGYGFIHSEIDNNNYYFKIYSLQNKIILNDKVIFIIDKTKNNKVAISIRKIFTNKNGINFIPRINSNHIHLELNDFFPTIIEYVKDYNEDFLELEHEFPHSIGKTFCISTKTNSRIIYGIRKGRIGHSRFILDEEPEDCNTITCVLKKIDNYYLII